MRTIPSVKPRKMAVPQNPHAGAVPDGTGQVGRRRL